MEKRRFTTDIKDFARRLAHQAMLLQWMAERMEQECTCSGMTTICIDEPIKALSPRKNQLPSKGPKYISYVPCKR
jgi:hypothetical protein